MLQLSGEPLSRPEGRHVRVSSPPTWTAGVMQAAVQLEPAYEKQQANSLTESTQLPGILEMCGVTPVRTRVYSEDALIQLSVHSGADLLQEINDVTYHEWLGAVGELGVRAGGVSCARAHASPIGNDKVGLRAHASADRTGADVVNGIRDLVITGETLIEAWAGDGIVGLNKKGCGRKKCDRADNEVNSAHSVREFAKRRKDKVRDDTRLCVRGSSRMGIFFF
jgi:hypothetical protein